jgi:anti-sigma factor RsiW
MTDRERGAGLAQALDQREERALHAYHDGELRGLARWRFERRLARSPALQRELRGLSELRLLLRERAAAATGPELWDGIAARLPVADARRQAAAAERSPARGLGWLPPLGAAAAALAVAAVVAQQWLTAPALEQAGVVRWMDSRGSSVMVLEEDEQNEVTIIWLLDGGPGAPAAGDGRAAS